ncbi:hypothetical protein EDI_305650 [Entamoeba dispar SAW760]|uniref:Fe-containing alcohol dehydrogenase-like C-terminal domain-containing protein n=1 Tax=Entamoeba dispar (strain ATCC PRA-260 / SAW760) TaxID=370354 RepID=B0E5Z3_ENTDS|nr:uncharacterized protein EDI_305650 [Entamoeba dispar SAW760]EDR30052.1 hypothetical protein EDI_305650 [Entamoeba dispar SAW760]|eukprot:EDR30052.1 hypothetical protein EDI_305650 [Entamoeba dispar SAW760]
MNGKKYPLAGYSLTPSLAVIDPMFTMLLQKKAIKDTGIDGLVHTTEAEAIKLIFENLLKSYNGVEARENMHNAVGITGIVVAFIGMDHSMFHKVRASFHLPHSSCVAVLLPHTIRYNGQKPRKLAM